MMDRSEVFQFLRGRGIAHVKVSFSGGNDEGGVDEIYAVGPTGEEVKLPEAVHVPQRYDESARQWISDNSSISEEQVRINAVHDALSDPVYERYYTFAGEFYVNGVLEWDVQKERVLISGDEEIPRSEHFEDEV